MTGVVSAAETAGKGEISSFNNYGENGKYTSIGKYEVAYGSAITDVTQKLPSTLTATMTTTWEKLCPILKRQWKRIFPRQSIRQEKSIWKKEVNILTSIKG